MARTHQHLGAILCVLLLNIQLFAANALGCVHQADAGATATDCLHLDRSAPSAATANLDATATDTTAVEPCQKCDLNSVAAGWHLFAARPPVLASTASPPPRAASTAKPSTRSPDGPLRPPQRLSA